MIVAVDLDHTLCIPNEDGKDSVTKYAYAEAIMENIQKVNDLYDQGHTIVIYTARRMLTHKGNIAKVVSDIGQITIDWLVENGVKYHDVVFGKMYYDLIIDDKAINARDW